MTSEALIIYRLNELKELITEHTKQDNKNFEALEQRVLDAQLDIQALKTQAMVWGGVAAVIVSCIVSVGMSLVLRHLGLPS